MTHRERIRAAVRYQPPDRLPVHESFWDDTIARWREQGLPAAVTAEDYFDFDLCFMSIDASPRFEQKVLAREGPYITYEDRYGYTARKLAEASSTIEFLVHRTPDREAWERIKPRFRLSDDPSEPARIDDASYFAHFDPYPTWEQAVQKYHRLRATGRYMLFAAYGPREASWRHRGQENQLLDYAEDPDLQRDMGDTHTSLVLDVLGKCLQLGMKPDGIFLVEDLGWKRSLMLSPQCWREVCAPSMRRLGQFLSRHGIDYWMHSDGAIHPILDDLIDCGVQVLNPLEVAAGMDVLDLHRRYHGRLAFYGNISIAGMLGPRDALEREVRAKSLLAREGGYIFHSDHSVPPQVAFGRYAWMLETARQAFASG